MESLRVPGIQNLTSGRKLLVISIILPQNDFANECLLSFLATPKSPATK